MARLLAFPLVLATLLLAVPALADEPGDWQRTRRDRSLGAGDEVGDTLIKPGTEEPQAESAAPQQQPPANAAEETVNVGRWLSGWGPVDSRPVR